LEARKVSVGLASHWPCVTDFVVYPPLDSKAYEREVSTQPMDLYGLLIPFQDGNRYYQNMSSASSVYLKIGDPFNDNGN